MPDYYKPQHLLDFEDRLPSSAHGSDSLSLNSFNSATSTNLEWDDSAIAPSSEGECRPRREPQGQEGLPWPWQQRPVARPGDGRPVREPPGSKLWLGLRTAASQDSFRRSSVLLQGSQGLLLLPWQLSGEMERHACRWHCSFH